MLSHNLKRYLSLFLSILMVFSLMPVSAWAAEEDAHDHSSGDTQGTTTAALSSGAYVPNPALAEYQAVVDDILNYYLGTTSMTDEQLQTAVTEMDPDTCYEAYYEIVSLDVELEYAYDEGILSDADMEYFLAANTLLKNFSDSIHEKAMQAAPNISFFAAKTVTPITGVDVTDSSGTGSLSGGTVTITAKGNLFSQAENNITIQNASENTATLSFNYSVSNANSFTIAGQSAGTSGSYSVLLAKDATLAIYLKSNSGFSNTTATLTLSNFSLVEAAANSDVTIEYDSSAGSVTAAGSAVDSGSTIQDVSMSEGVTLVATPNGSTFLGWIDQSTHQLLSNATSYTYKPAGDSTVAAAFLKADAKAWFSVGTKYYDDLNVAATAAVSGGGVVILAADGTLPAGNYTIPEGVTLLIPYDAANTLCTTKPTIDGSTGLFSSSANAWVTPTAYRTLSMATGANITVNGAISLSGKMCINQGSNGCPSGPLGFVNMASGSNITINNGANLYAWGYITGSGAVTVKSGGTVYENFQVKDWRGGTAASAMIDKTQKVFPVSQYYVQNVEVPMALETGAKEYGYMGIVASKCYGDATVPFIGSGSMFINAGTITKDYNENTDRLEVDISGNLSMSSLILSVDGGLATYDMNSANYVLPITNNLTVRVNSGTTTISQDMCFLPGSEVIIGENATVKIADGINLYVYDLEEWAEKLFVYPAKDVAPLLYVGAKKGAPVSRSLSDAKIVVNGELNSSTGYLYTTAGGANITSDGGGHVVTGTAGTATITYQATQSGTAITFVNVPVTAAKLLNKDTTYQATTTEGITYTYTDGKWICDAEVNEHIYENNVCTICGYEKGCEHSYTSEVTKEATCNEAGIKTYTCSNCGNSYTEEIEKLTTHTPNEDDGDCTTEITCSVCGTVTTPAETSHTGGSATCKVLAVCTKCGKSYGDLAAHTPGEAATCTTAQTCTVCGAELVAALGHDFSGAWQKDDTNHWKKCSRCDATDQTAAHSYGDWIVDTAATCTAAGSQHKVCSCGHTVTEAIAALGHNLVDVAGKEATCTEDGYTAYKDCSRCDYIEGKETIAKVGHNYGNPTYTGDGKTSYVATRECTCGDTQTATAVITSTVTKEATCTAEGETTYTADFTEIWAEDKTTTESIAKLPHSYGDPTYTGDGKTSYVATRECTCGDTQTATAGITSKVTKAATCTAEGETTYTADFTETWAEDKTTTESIAKLPHSYGEPQFTWNGYACTAKVICSCGHEQGVDVTVTSAETTEATCTVKGVKTYTATAVWNEQTYTSAEHPTEDLGLNSNNHKNTKEEAQTDATCTSIGYTAGVYCNDCEKWISGHVEIPQAAHNYGDPTYTGDGKTSYVATRECTCGDTQTATAEITSAVTKEATCTAEGETTYTADFTETWAEDKTTTESIAKLAHSYGEPQFTWNGYACTAKVICSCGDEQGVNVDVTSEVTTTATCKVEGIRTYTATAVYGDKTYTETKTENLGLDAENHNMVSGEVVAPTCTESGYTVYTCSNCDKTEERDAVEATGHSYEAVVTAPTCTESGYTTYTCACGDTYVADEVAAAGHKYTSEETKAPTCTEKGIKTFTCTCGDAYTEEIAATGHTLTQVEAKAPTCTEAGYEAYEYCSVCDYTTYKEVAATGHNYEAVVTAPTCTEAGYTTYTCACGDSYIADEVPALGHTEETISGKAATCTEAGLTDGVKCSACGEILTAQEEIPALGHNHTSEVTTAPTCTTAGVETFTCGSCGDTYTEVIEATGTHEYTNGFCDGCDGYEPAKLNGDVYEISNAGQLYWFAKKVNDGEPALDAKLMNDISVNEGFIILNENGEFTFNWSMQTRYFNPIQLYTGTFDGCGYQISGLRIGGNGPDGMGFITELNGGTVQNLSIVESYISNSDFGPTGAIIGNNNRGLIKNCVSRASVSGYRSIGGIVGTNSGTVADCLNQYTVYGKNFSNSSQTILSSTGGIAGYSTGAITNCKNTGSISGDEKVGGIVGQIWGCTISECENSGNITLRTSNYAGGIVGYCKGVVTKCHNSGTLTIGADGLMDLGGIAGYVAKNNNESITVRISDCFNTGTIDANSTGSLSNFSASYVGGIAGNLQGSVTIENCYHTGNVSGHVWVGAIVGAPYSAATISNCYYLEQSARNGYNRVQNGIGYSTVSSTQSDTDGQTMVMTADQFTSGEVAYLLNADRAELVWFQTCGEGYPAFSGLTVYQNQTSGCTDETYTFEYANEPKDAITSHKEEILAAAAPDCTNTGLTEGKHCSVCGEVLVAQEVVAALGHDEVAHEAQTPTCTEIGWDAYVTCTRCDYSTYVEKAALDHEFAETLSYDENGHWYACTRTGCTEKKDAENHVWDHACDTDCNDGCGYTRTITHSYTVASEEIVTEANCVTVAEYKAKCAVCGDISDTERITGTTDATKHTGKTDVRGAKDATCVDEGYTGDTYCSSCNTKLQDGEVIAKLTTHTYPDNWTQTKAPTCTEKGSEYRQCTVEGCVSTETRDIAMVAHTMSHTAAKEATCAETGNHEYWYCSVCKGYFKDEQGAEAYAENAWVIEKIDHIFETTYTTDGQYHWFKCTNSECDAVDSKEVHSFGSQWKHDDSNHWHECVCGDKVDLDTHGWDDGVVTTQPTFSAAGVKTYTCGTCGTTRTETIDKLTGTTVAVDVLTNNLETGPQITLLSGTTAGEGWDKEGNVIAGSTVDFSVTFDKACVVIVETTDTDGNLVYTKVPAVATADKNTYNFSTAVVEGMKIIVAVKGDVTGDGAIKVKDTTIVRGLYLGLDVTVSELERILADVTNDGAIKVKDTTIVRGLYLGLDVTVEW